MKKIVSILVLGLAILIPSVAGAFTLEPANILPMGKPAVFVGAVNNTTSPTPPGFASNGGILTYGVIGGVGIWPGMDASLGIGLNNLNNLTAGISAKGTSTLIGGNIRRAFLSESLVVPLSVTGAIEYQVSNIPVTITGPGDSTTVNNDLGIRVIGSKFINAGMLPIIPYVGVAYHSYNTTVTGFGAATTSSTGTEFSIGSYVFVAKQLAPFLEFASTTTTPSGGGATSTTSQLAGGLAATF